MVGSSASGASRLVLDVVELQRRTGTRRDVGASLVLPDLEVGERCVLDGRLDVDLVVEAATEGIVAVGTVRGESRVPCRRCLDDVIEPLEVEMREIFERHPTEGETWPIEDERIDLTPVVRELALLDRLCQIQTALLKHAKLIVKHVIVGQDAGICIDLRLGFAKSC